MYFDPTFTPQERAGIESGLALWTDAAPEVRFVVVASPRADLFIVPGEHCPHDLTAARVGLTTSSGVICVDANADAIELPKIVAHEMGHALGLAHMPSPSIMAPLECEMASRPTQGDVTALLSL